MFLRTREMGYLLLFAMSVLLVIWQHLGMATRLNINLGGIPDLPPYVHSDHINGGISTTDLRVEDGHIFLDCDIKLSEIFAFCGVTIPIVETGRRGIDLNQYSKMHIEFEYGGAQEDTLLVYLNKIQKGADAEGVVKANTWPVIAKPGLNRYTVNPRRFFIPSWWVYLFHGQVENTRPDISDIVSISFTTGDNREPRQPKIAIKQVSFTGKWIEADDLYRYLLIAWLLLIFVHGTYLLRKLFVDYQASKEQNRNLIELNEFLSIQRDEFETMAKTDKLTGSLNRAGIRDILQAARRDYARAYTPCSLISLDLDHFKSINDEHGHDVGDRVLQKMVEIIQSNTRNSDHLVRWGGDEFNIICTKAVDRIATKIAEQLRREIEKAEFIEGHTVSCSFGVASLTADGISDWFKRADQALYKAKELGRNRVVVDKS